MSSLQVGGPIQDNFNRRGTEFVIAVGNQKLLAVCCDRELRLSGIEAGNAQIEQRLRRPDLEVGPVGFNVYGHHFLVGGDVEQLLAIAPPRQVIATVSRDLPLAA
jgi:hypothetical protein